MRCLVNLICFSKKNIIKLKTNATRQCRRLRRVYPQSRTHLPRLYPHLTHAHPRTDPDADPNAPPTDAAAAAAAADENRAPNGLHQPYQPLSLKLVMDPRGKVQDMNTLNNNHGFGAPNGGGMLSPDKCAELVSALNTTTPQGKGKYMRAGVAAATAAAAAAAR